MYSRAHKDMVWVFFLFLYMFIDSSCIFMTSTIVHEYGRKKAVKVFKALIRCFFSVVSI